MPKRIQRRRTKGFRLPDGAVVVTRPTRFGNPFRVMGRNEYLYCDASHRRTILTPWVIFDHDQDWRRNPATPEMAVAYYRRWLAHEFDGFGVVRPCNVTAADLESLRGKDLACWCREGDPCHGDVLLVAANS